MQSRDDEDSTLSSEVPASGLGRGTRLTRGFVLSHLYRIEEEIGSGGFAHVYRATLLATGEPLALKVLDPQYLGTQMATRFAREARAIQAIRHPNVVDVLDFGVTENGLHHYLVMELLQGQTLHAVLKARGRLSPEEGIEIARQICSALGAAHALGIVHRDVKAGNVILLPGTPPVVKLLDFGIAKFLEADASGLTARNQRIGSALTMAPEQICGMPIDARTDIYSLGVVLFQLFTGRYPFRPRDGDLHELHLTALPPNPSTFAPLPRSLETLVLRCLEKRPDDRPGSIQEVLDALAAVARTDALEGAAPPVRRRAVAVSVELRMEALAEDDGELLFAMNDISERAEVLLEKAQFQLCIRSVAAVLGVQVVDPEPGGAAAAESTAAGIVAALEALPLPPEIRLCIRMQTGDAEWNPTTGEITGGTLLSTESWQDPGQGGETAARTGLPDTTAVTAGES